MMIKLRNSIFFQFVSDYDHENGVPVGIKDDSVDGSINEAVASEVFCTPQSEMRQTRSASRVQHQAVPGMFLC